MQNHLVSVIIPTYNRQNMIGNCIKSVINSTYKNIEIIIVDNASTDDTLSVLETIKENSDVNMCIVSMAHNVMAAGGRNVGIMRACGEYLLFIDDDNEIYPDMIEMLVGEMEKDADVGLGAPLAFNNGRTWTTSISYNWWTSRCYDTFSECVGKTESEVDSAFKEKYQTWAGSPNVFMVSRRAIEAVGGLDFSMYMTFEESDFACRILRAGFTEYIYTKPRTNHLGWIRDEENTRLRQLCLEPANRAYYFCRNRTVFMKRYARWYHLITYYLFFFHFFWVYYAFNALREGRRDIARAVIRGAFVGLFVRNDTRIRIPIVETDYSINKIF